MPEVSIKDIRIVEDKQRKCYRLQVVEEDGTETTLGRRFATQREAMRNAVRYERQVDALAKKVERAKAKAAGASE